MGVACPSLRAARQEFWETKDPPTWTKEEKEVLLWQSPWARQGFARMDEKRQSPPDASRRGQVVEMPVRRSRVTSLELLGYEGGIAGLDLRVGSGTYVRSIADALGGHCRTLRRLEVGPFSVDDADGERLLPAAEALPFLPRVEVGAEEAAAIRAGRRPAVPDARTVCAGELVAVGRVVMPA